MVRLICDGCDEGSEERWLTRKGSLSDAMVETMDGLRPPYLSTAMK